VIKLQDVFTNDELYKAVGERLQVEWADEFPGAEVELIDWVADQIGFEITFDGDKWYNGYVRMSYDTDLDVYISDEAEAELEDDDEEGELDEETQIDCSYSFSICWCDLIPDGIEVEGL
jgi:hypothetical protein